MSPATTYFLLLWWPRKIYVYGDHTTYIVAIPFYDDQMTSAACILCRGHVTSNAVSFFMVAM